MNQGEVDELVTVANREEVAVQELVAAIDQYAAVRQAQQKLEALPAEQLRLSMDRRRSSPLPSEATSGRSGCAAI